MSHVQRDSLCQRLTGFEEADVKMKRLQLRSRKRATESHAEQISWFDVLASLELPDQRAREL